MAKNLIQYRQEKGKETPQKERRICKMKKVKIGKLKIGSVLCDLNNQNLIVKGFRDLFIIATYGNGEVWLVPSHLEHYKVVRY